MLDIGTISVNSTGFGDAGNIEITAGQIDLMGDCTFDACPAESIISATMGELGNFVNATADDLEGGTITITGLGPGSTLNFSGGVLLT